ncbi:MAG TPA: HAD-IB family hydrolase [Actinocrinis sp.]|nr:HAD-IB family hydrolase [Actinocrinis sp.]
MVLSSPAARLPLLEAAEPHRAPRTAAFFDLDNTLIRGASLFHLARGLTAHHFLSMGELAKFGCAQVGFRIWGERDEQLDTTRSKALAFVRGHSVVQMRQICRDIYDEYLSEKIWPGTRALAQAHLDRNEAVWLVTAAPLELAEVVAEQLGLTGALGTVPEAVDGVYTGGLTGQILHGPAKATAVAELAGECGYRLGECHAYSDSANDLPLLTAVGHPHAINPDHKLRHHARSVGWPVTDYRTGMRLLQLGLPGAAAVGATVSAVAAGGALRRAGRH